MTDGEQESGQEQERESREEPKRDTSRTGPNERYTIPIQMF